MGPWVVELLGWRTLCLRDCHTLFGTGRMGVISSYCQSGARRSRKVGHARCHGFKWHLCTRHFKLQACVLYYSSPEYIIGELFQEGLSRMIIISPLDGSIRSKCRLGNWEVLYRRQCFLNGLESKEINR